MKIVFALSFAMLPALFFIDELFGTLNELGFVVRVIVFSYLVYWFYITFRDAQMVFGLSVVVIGYIIFVHSLSVTLLTVVFFFFVVFGNILQMLLMFSILPIFGYQFTGREYVKMHGAEEMAAVQQSALVKMEAGQALNATEAQVMEQMQAEQTGQTRLGMGRMQAS